MSSERTSTEVVKPSTFKSPAVDNILPEMVNEVAADSCSLLEDITIPDVGSYVSLSDISILKFSDIHFDDSNSTNILTVENIESDKDTSKVITVAEVHNDPTLQKDTEHLKNNTFDSTAEQSDKTCTVTGKLSITVDTFEKHLKYPIESKPTNKKRHISKFPSAISSKAWRDYHNMKEKEKNKRKIEKEQKKNEPAAKRKKIKDKENTNNKKKVNISKNMIDKKTDDRRKISDSFILKTNRVYVHTNKKGINVKTKDKKVIRNIRKEMDLVIEKQVEVHFDGEESNKKTLEASFAETRDIGEETKHEYKRKAIENTITENDLLIEKKASENNKKKEPRVKNRKYLETVGQFSEEEEEEENILLSDFEETVGKTKGETDEDEDDLTIF